MPQEENKEREGPKVEEKSSHELEDKDGYGLRFMKDLPENGVPEQNTIYVKKIFDKLNFSITISSEENPNSPIQGPFEKKEASSQLVNQLRFRKTFIGTIYQGVLDINIQKNDSLTLNDLESIKPIILEALRAEGIILAQDEGKEEIVVEKEKKEEKAAE